VPHTFKLFDAQTGTKYDPSFPRKHSVEISYVNAGGVTTENLFHFLKGLSFRTVSLFFNTQWITLVELDTFKQVLTLLNPKIASILFVYDIDGKVLGLKLELEHDVPENHIFDIFDLRDNRLWRVPVPLLIKFFQAIPLIIQELRLLKNDLYKHNPDDLLALLSAIPKHLKVADVSENGLESYPDQRITPILADFQAASNYYTLQSLYHCVWNLLLNGLIQDWALKIIKPTHDLSVDQLGDFIQQLDKDDGPLSPLIAAMLLANRVQLTACETAPITSKHLEIRMHAAIDRYATVASDVSLRPFAHLLLWGIQANTKFSSVSERLQGFDVPLPPLALMVLSPYFRKPRPSFFMDVPRSLSIQIDTEKDSAESKNAPK